MSTFSLIVNSCCYKKVCYYSNLVVLYVKISCGNPGYEPKLGGKSYGVLGKWNKNATGVNYTSVVSTVLRF